MSVNNINEVQLDSFLVENYFTYGHYVNFHRVIPGIDGLKPVHRRVLLGVKEVADGSLTSTVNALGAVQKIHPFGTISLESTMADMVRLGVIDGEGSFGAKLLEEIPAAASRYTRTGITKKQSDYYFRLSDYSPEIEGEVEMEPEYLITPVPYAITYGALNWGLGIMGRTPAFTYASLVEAYYADDYTKLKSQFDYILDEEKSDLKSLWENGSGNVSLKYKITRLDADNILLVGSGELFVPKFNSIINELISSGQILVINESSNKVAIRISRVSRSRVDMDEVYKHVLFAGSNSRPYNILVVHEGKIRTIGIREWLQITMGKYKEAFAQYKADRVAKCEYNIQVLNYLPVVGRLIIDNKTDEEIMKSVEGLTEEILTTIKRKTISSLRKTEYSSDIESINKQIVSIQAEDVDSVIKSYV